MEIKYSKLTLRQLSDLRGITESVYIDNENGLSTFCGCVQDAKSYSLFDTIAEIREGGFPHAFLRNDIAKRWRYIGVEISDDATFPIFLFPYEWERKNNDVGILANNRQIRKDFLDWLVAKFEYENVSDSPT